MTNDGSTTLSGRDNAAAAADSTTFSSSCSPTAGTGGHDQQGRSWSVLPNRDSSPLKSTAREADEAFAVFTDLTTGDSSSLSHDQAHVLEQVEAFYFGDSIRLREDSTRDREREGDLFDPSETFLKAEDASQIEGLLSSEREKTWQVQTFRKLVHDHLGIDLEVNRLDEELSVLCKLYGIEPPEAFVSVGNEDLDQMKMQLITKAIEHQQTVVARTCIMPEVAREVHEFVTQKLAVSELGAEAMKKKWESQGASLEILIDPVTKNVFYKTGEDRVIARGASKAAVVAYDYFHRREVVLLKPLAKLSQRAQAEVDPFSTELTKRADSAPSMKGNMPFTGIMQSSVPSSDSSYPPSSPGEMLSDSETASFADANVPSDKTPESLVASSIKIGETTPSSVALQMTQEVSEQSVVGDSSQAGEPGASSSWGFPETIRRSSNAAAAQAGDVRFADHGKEIQPLVVPQVLEEASQELVTANTSGKSGDVWQDYVFPQMFQRKGRLSFKAELSQAAVMQITTPGSPSKRSGLEGLDESQREFYFASKFSNARGIIETLHINEKMGEMIQPRAMALDKLINQQADISTSLKAVKGAIQGLVTMHREECLHRDIKPGNILYDQNEGKLCDLGSTCLLQGDPFIKEYRSTVLYSSPELMAVSIDPGSSEKLIGKANDIWSMGMVLYLAQGKKLEEHPLFSSLLEGTQITQMYLLSELYLNQERKALYEKEYPEPDDRHSLDHLVWRCLRPNPEERPTAEELLDNYSQILNHMDHQVQ